MSSRTILCFGPTPAAQRTMVFERLALDAVNRAVQVREYASGKALNVARVLHILGEQPCATGFIGGARGEFLSHDLSATNIRHSFVTVASETRLCTTVIDRVSGTATELIEEPGAVATSDVDRLAARLQALLPTVAVAVFSGSLPPGAPADLYARWLPDAYERGTTVIVDARGESLSLAMEHPGFIFKINQEELAATLNIEIHSRPALLKALRSCIPRDGGAVVTLGADGAIAADRNGYWEIRPPTVKAISAVGSGDAFAAGLAAGLSGRQSLNEASALGAACGAAMTENAGHVQIEDVNDLLPRMHIVASKWE